MWGIVDLMASVLQPMTAALKKRINALTRLQNEHDTIEDELQEEVR
jgi:hypothetical protein